MDEDDDEEGRGEGADNSYADVDDDETDRLQVADVILHQQDLVNGDAHGA